MRWLPSISCLDGSFCQRTTLEWRAEETPAGGVAQRSGAKIPSSFFQRDGTALDRPDFLFSPQERRALHRLNYCSKRKLWEMDYADREIRLAASRDAAMGPLTPGQFRGAPPLHGQGADTVLPSLTSSSPGA